MIVGSICSHRPITVSTSAPISDVAGLMKDEHVGAVIVTESRSGHRQVAGIITDRDIVRAQLETTADLSRLAAADVMTRDPLVVGEAEPIDGAIAHLRARGVRRAPVVSPAGALVGLISVDDLLAHLARELIGLAGIVAQQVRAEHE